MVPNGWEVTTLGEHVTISSGYSPSKYVLAESGSFPFVKVEDMNNCAKYQSISRTYTETNGSPIGKGAVIFPKRGAAIMNNKVRIADVAMYLDTNMMALTPKKSVFSEYLHYTLIKEELYKIADTSTIPQINNKHILPYRFKLPPLPEQRKIAQILSTWDRGIATTEKLIDASKQQKKALMQQLLTGKKRLVDPETGKAFEGDWAYVQAGSIFATRSNKKHNSDLLILAITQDQGAVPRELIDYNVSVTQGSIAGYKVVEIGDFIISLRSFQGGIEYSKYKGICSPAYVILYPKIEISDDFYKYHLKSFSFIQAMKSRLEGIRDGKIISYKYFSEIKLPQPSLKEQEKIASVLTAADKDIELLAAKLAHFKQEKKALMQQLLTGKRRVSLSS
ncbi:restriction endonuclease subunit S [Photobacterium phosphoreum]|uniref:restriction endonuclease subunit S n=1 Tax=Photobacterium phosphoreum TaxID=659 RepID=UPI001E309CBE|nr:restriction endonuclease subunit S [Photobacterium phosphoreum]MCD9508423.1 restriction endonuclease subunit S [Photobacterium phosphoreum]